METSKSHTLPPSATFGDICAEVALTQAPAAVKKPSDNVKVKLRFSDLSVKVRPIEWHCKIKRKEGNLQ